MGQSNAMKWKEKKIHVPLSNWSINLCVSNNRAYDLDSNFLCCDIISFYSHFDFQWKSNGNSIFRILWYTLYRYEFAIHNMYYIFFPLLSLLLYFTKQWNTNSAIFVVENWKCSIKKLNNCNAKKKQTKNCVENE